MDNFKLQINFRKNTQSFYLLLALQSTHLSKDEMDTERLQMTV